MAFDPLPARRGLDYINLSFARWSEFLDVHPARPMASSEIAAEQNFHANSHVIGIVRWIRSVDDYLAGVDATLDPCPGYADARSAAAVQGLFDGLRHAAHKSLHLLTTLATTPAVYMKAESHLGAGPPPPPRRPNNPIYLWPDLAHLPARGGDRGRRARLAYATHLARHEVDPVLVTVVNWLRSRRL